MVLATTKRTPKRFANYKGDLTSNIELGKIMGHNMMNELMTVVSVEYNSDTDKTRVGFDFTREYDYPHHSDYPWGDNAHR